MNKFFVGQVLILAVQLANLAWNLITTGGSWATPICVAGVLVSTIFTIAARRI